ncbi:MAG: helix-hairpin-helix domain-containing protein [Clostridiales Family XIII bacterium]|jgi:competence ComEA-like helix-hairpin-helix protein|nr:helix-hairpin-helix domain-containing protein [Clostridiales Family XIII bacterium]
MKNFSIRTALFTAGLVIVLTCGLLISGAEAGYARDLVKQDSGTGSLSYSDRTLPVVLPLLAKVKIKIKITLPKPVKIKFNGNGGTVSSADKTVFKGLKFGTLPTAKRSGYTFKGWFTTKKGGSCITSDTVVKLTRTKTYYAHWAKAEIYGPPTPSVSELKVNINTASAAKLQDITGIGPKLADAIIAYRNAYGPFQKAEDLMKVKGIGKAKYKKMQDQIKV